MTTMLSLSNDLAAAVERVAPAVVAVHARRHIASTGVHWRPGAIVTASHTVRVEDNITVTLADGRTAAATLAGRDPGTDLAVLRIAESEPPVVGLGEAAPLKVGHVVLAVGYGPRASWGVVAALGGRWRTWRGGEIDQLVRLDLTLYPGFSGGPLVDADGRVVGINTSGLSQRLELAVPAATVARVAGELLDTGRVRRGFLGVGLHPVRLPEGAARLASGRAAEMGLIVVSLEPGGPAATAGLLLGDVVFAVDGEPVDAPEALAAAVGSRAVGSRLTASILRGGGPAEIQITLGERPSRGR